MPYTAQFFQEKLNVPVEYFNPFRNVQIDPAVNLEELSRVAHSLGEVVGLGLRNLANCPVEMNLMPESTLRWQTFNQKKPYFIFTVISLVLVAGAVGFLFEKLAESKETEIQKLEPEVAARTAKSDQFNRVYSQLQDTQKEAEQIAVWMEQRYYWADVLTQLRGALIRSEDDVKKKLSAQKSGVEAGIWIEQFITMGNLANAAAGGAANPSPDNSGADTGQTINVICRAVNLTSVDPSANSEIAYAVETQLKAVPIFDPKATQLTGNITADDSNGTFTFGVTITLQNPLKL
jgi:hypothetical protein